MIFSSSSHRRHLVSGVRGARIRLRARPCADWKGSSSRPARPDEPGGRAPARRSRRRGQSAERRCHETSAAHWRAAARAWKARTPFGAPPRRFWAPAPLFRGRTEASTSLIRRAFAHLHPSRVQLFEEQSLIVGTDGETRGLPESCVRGTTAGAAFPAPPTERLRTTPSVSRDSQSIRRQAIRVKDYIPHHVVRTLLPTLQNILTTTADHFSSSTIQIAVLWTMRERRAACRCSIVCPVLMRRARRASRHIARRSC